MVPWGIVSPCYTASGTREINGPGLSKASGLLLCSTITSNVLSSTACSAIDNGVFEEEEIKQREEMWFMRLQWIGGSQMSEKKTDLISERVLRAIIVVGLTHALNK